MTCENKQYSIIQLRRGNESQFSSSNIVLASGEPAYAIDTKKFKIGDGSTPWNSLSNIGTTVIVPEDIQDIVGSGFLVGGSGINISYDDNLNNLTISTTGVSFASHQHLSSDITNFNSSVSGLVNGIYAPLNSPNFSGTLSISGVTLAEIIDDEVAGLLIAGSGINLNYDDSSNTLTISSSGAGVSSSMKLGTIMALT